MQKVVQDIISCFIWHQVVGTGHSRWDAGVWLTVI